MMKRLKYIDAIKGIAIFLVVLGHMLRGFSSANMYGDYNNIIQYIDFTIYSFHVPLFFIASGLLYNYKIKIETNEEYLTFIKKKAKILIIPYIVFSWMQVAIKLVMSKSVNHIVKPIEFFTIIYKPVEQFWFLYTLLIIFILVSFCDYKIRNEKTKLGIFIVLYFLTAFVPDLWILKDIFQYTIYFYLGRFLLKIKQNNILLILTLSCYWIANILLYKNKIGNEVTSLIIAILGILMVTMICKTIKNNRIFECLGRYSMPIFLLHTIFGSGIRIILNKFHLNNIFIQVSFGLIFGIVIPIIIYKGYKKISFAIIKKINSNKKLVNTQ